MERKTITFKFEGDLEGVSVGTFTAALLGYSRAVQASARELDPNAVIDVEITATRPGCLEAILQAVVKDLPGILGTLSQTSDQLEPVLSAFKGYLELRRFLGKNGAPKSVERVGDGISVTAGNNSVINITQNVYKVSGSNEVDSAVSSMFGVLADNEKIGGLSISGDGVDGFESSRDDFEDIRTAPKCETEQERDVIMKGQHLNVAKPVLEYRTSANGNSTGTARSSRRTWGTSTSSASSRGVNARSASGTTWLRICCSVNDGTRSEHGRTSP